MFKILDLTVAFLGQLKFKKVIATSFQVNIRGILIVGPVILAV